MHLSFKLSVWFTKLRFKDRNPVSVSDLGCQIFQSLVTMYYTNNYNILQLHLLQLIFDLIKDEASAGTAVSVKPLSVASTVTGALNSNSQVTWVLPAFVYQTAALTPKLIVF